jgi:hypothetical protein
MSHQIKVEPHPLGVVVIDEHDGGRELLIEGESCCGVSFDDLKRIASTTHHFEVPDQVALTCRLKRL